MQMSVGGHLGITHMSQWSSSIANLLGGAHVLPTRRCVVFDCKSLAVQKLYVNNKYTDNSKKYFDDIIITWHGHPKGVGTIYAYVNAVCNVFVFLSFGGKMQNHYRSVTMIDPKCCIVGSIANY